MSTSARRTDVMQRCTRRQLTSSAKALRALSESSSRDESFQATMLDAAKESMAMDAARGRGDVVRWRRKLGRPQLGTCLLAACGHDVRARLPSFVAGGKAAEATPLPNRARGSPITVASSNPTNPKVGHAPRVYARTRTETRSLYLITVFCSRSPFSVSRSPFSVSWIL